MKNKKIAVLHNYIDNIGGAEIVTLHLARGLGADVYTTNIDSEKILKMGFGDVLPRIKSIGKIPKSAPFKQQIALFKFRKLNLGKKYDFYVISGDWAMSAAVNNRPNLWYAHSPLNEIWEFKDHIKKNLLSGWQKLPYEAWVKFNRSLTKKYAKKVNIWICNSNNTRGRIKKYYNKNATVVNPPIECNKYTSSRSKNYWLSVNRLISNKRIDLQLKSFSKMPNENLIIVGSYEKGVRQFELDKKYLEKIKPKNVKISNWINDKKLKKLYSECRGFITTSRDEDFGMTVVEAMASGKPVIAPNEGGYMESVKNGETGILIDSIDENKIIKAIGKINYNLNNNVDVYKDKCINQAKKFDIKIFIKKLKEAINNYDKK